MAYWSQYQANPANQGYAPLTTRPATTPKWQIEVGPIAFASPVIGLDGIIYIGNLWGELLAIAPDGNIKWRKRLDTRGSFIPASAAIDDAGNIYVISTFRAKVRDHTSGASPTVTYKIARSKLHSLAPDGTQRWTFPFPRSNTRFTSDGYSLSSPKIAGKTEKFIFITSRFSHVAPRLELFVLNLAGNLITRLTVTEYPTPPVTTPNGIYDLFAGIWDFLNGAEFNPRGDPTLKQQFGQAEPSIAIADFGPFRDQPIIVIDDNYKQLSAWQWQATNASLTPLWQKTSAEPRLCATPSIFLSSMVAVGQNSGHLAFYDLQTGQELWKPWFKAKNAIISPAAAFVSQIYLLSDTRIMALDANGRLIREFALSNTQGGALGAPAISMNQVYVNAQEGVFSFSLDLSQYTQNSLIPGGVSSPAIGDDGTIYLADRNKQLWAMQG